MNWNDAFLTAALFASSIIMAWILFGNPINDIIRIIQEIKKK